MLTSTLKKKCVVDFAKLVKRTPEADIHALVGPVVADLSVVPSADRTESISHLFLCEEVFESLVKLPVMSDEYIDRAKGMKSPATTTGMPAIDSSMTTTSRAREQ